MINFKQTGKTPYIPLKDFSSWGYNIVIYPVSTLRVANKAIDSFLKDLSKNGT